MVCLIIYGFGKLWEDVHCRIFPWKFLTSINGLKFHMQVSDADANIFCKFDEIGELWEDVRIS